MSRLSGLFIALSAFACGEPSAADGAGAGEFIAFTPDFADFRSWTELVPSFAAPGNEHISGPRRVYLNSVPSPDSSTFPLGTIFVKESGDGPVRERELFAVAKRGGGFNPDGAQGWEWFKLLNYVDDTPFIEWRGANGEAGDAYGSGNTGGCNGCHNVPSYDYIWSVSEFGLLGAN